MFLCSSIVLRFGSSRCLEYMIVLRGYMFVGILCLVGFRILCLFLLFLCMFPGICFRRFPYIDILLAVFSLSRRISSPLFLGCSSSISLCPGCMSRHTSTHSPFLQISPGLQSLLESHPPQSLLPVHWLLHVALQLPHW